MVCHRLSIQYIVVSKVEIVEKTIMRMEFYFFLL
jgi:hypothetical protein